MATLGTFHDDSLDFQITTHARERMSARSIPVELVDMVLSYGRVMHASGAAIYVVGKREVVRFRSQGLRLERCEGVHVICSPDGALLTVYRNHDFSGLREKGRRCWH